MVFWRLMIARNVDFMQVQVLLRALPNLKIDHDIKYVKNV